MAPVRDSDPDPELDSAMACPAEIGGESALIYILEFLPKETRSFALVGPELGVVSLP